MIELLDISKSYSGKSIFENVSGRIEKGKFIGLLGNNGCGKSTLLRAIYKEESLDSGLIKIDNTDVTKLDRLSFSKKLSVVLAGRYHVPSMTVVELLATARYPYVNWSGRTDELGLRLIQKYIDEFKIRDLENRELEKLSDGEFQQVMICRSFVQDSDFIIMDEPSAFLDVLRKRNLFSKLAAFVKADKGVVVATHDIHESLDFCTHIWLIDGGKLVEYKQDSTELKPHLNRIFATNL